MKAGAPAHSCDYAATMAKTKTPIAELTEAERAAVASLIREHLRTTRNVLVNLDPLKSPMQSWRPAMVHCPRHGSR